MTGKLLFAALLGVVSLGLVPAKATAGNYTVYIYNVRGNSGWFRAGTDTYSGITEVYTSYSNCKNAIVKRVNDNRRYGYDNEAFAIVFQSSRPPEGALRSYISGTIVYIPGRGYYASLNTQSTRDNRAYVAGAAKVHAVSPCVCVPEEFFARRERAALTPNFHQLSNEV